LVPLVQEQIQETYIGASAKKQKLNFGLAMYNVGWIVDDEISVSWDRKLSLGKWFPT